MSSSDDRKDPGPQAPTTIAGDPSRDSTVVSGAPQSPQQRTPARLGRYSLIERLGVGGMAEVYLAEQAGAAGFQKKVVVKRILPHLAADTQFVQMFVREAKVAARVAHPNVVQVYELAEEGGEIFIAMEHIDGLTLHRLAAAAWEQGRAVPIDVVLRTMADAANGLHAAHILRDEMDRPVHLVHRDVSPDNLMVSKDGVTKVLDFGIAKGDLGGPKTKTGNLRGKIPFMPPEQIKGEVLDGRADLYALGVSAYWMLTGERPFDRQSDWHTMQAILNDEPKKASLHNAQVPRGLDDLLARLLQKDREKRPTTGKEVAEALEDLASPSSVGGKKTTVAFLSEVLPSNNSRGNPVSEVKPTAPPKPPEMKPQPEMKQVPAEPAPPAAPPPAAASTSSPEVRNTLPFVSESAQQEPPAPTPPPTAPPSTPERVKTGEEKPIVKPVTMPSGPNAIADVLAGPPRSGPPVALLVAGLVGVVVVALVVVFVVVPRLNGGAKVGADAGVVVKAADAGPAVVLVKPPPVEKVVVEAKGAPSRVRWKVGSDVVGLGEGKLSVPSTAKSLTAEDLRRGFSVEVPIEKGVADYGALPGGTIVIVRRGDNTTIFLGADDVSGQRRLKLPNGHYTFKLDTKGKKKDVVVEVQTNKQITLDAGK